jgi:hypothetical protein
MVNCISSRCQVFHVDSITPTLHYLVLTTDSTSDKWKLPYPTYRFETGDINGDGIVDAMVGVIKSTRYDKTMRRRIFIFKNYHGKIRALWLGTRLGGWLEDFRFINIGGEPRIRSIERDGDNKYFVSEYRWNSFGMEYVRLLGKEKSKKEAINILNE